jgi:hypothetical protein
MIPLLDGLQRITATLLVAGLYLLPASLGGLMSELDVDLATVASPERVASFVLQLPQGATIPMLAPAEPETPEAEKTPSPRAPADDMLAAPSGASSASAVVKEARGERRGEQRRGKGEGQTRGRGGRCMAPSGQITATGADQYQVERALLDYYFGDSEAAESIGSATWYRDERGDIAGVRIRRVRCGGPLEEAGLRQGDIIRSANGKRVDSLAGVIALWWQLRSKDSVKLQITRDGQRQRLRYTLV